MDKFFKEPSFDDYKDILEDQLEKGKKIDLEEVKAKEFIKLADLEVDSLDENHREFNLSLFAKINPNNLPLDILQGQLEDEINDLRVDLASISKNLGEIAHLSEQEKSDLYDKYSAQIKEKSEWINKIDDFLMTEDSTPFADYRREAIEELEKKWDSIENVDPELN